MPRIEPFYPAYPIARQVDIDTGSIVMINLLTMTSEDEAAWCVALAPEPQENLTAHPASIMVRPHLFAKVAAPDQCAA